MNTRDASTLKTMRRRSWRGVVLFAWLALAFVNLAGALSLQAAGPLTDAEILASICHVGPGSDDAAAAPASAEARHCPLCLVMGAGGLVPPPGQVALGRLPVQASLSVAVDAPERGHAGQVGRTASPRAPPVLT